MREYAEKFKIKKEKVLFDLYNKYWIQSRTELTREQIKKEIELYNLSISFWQK